MGEFGGYMMDAPEEAFFQHSGRYSRKRLIARAF
jgi:hypothetical protein